MTPEEITTVLKEAAEAFPALGSRQPEDEDIVAIREALVPILLRIPYDNAAVAPIKKHNLSGLIQRRTVYQNSRNDNAPFPAFVALGIYPSIADDAKQNIVRKEEAIHKVKLADEGRRLAAETGLSQFIFTVVDETWYKDLRDPDEFYTNVTAMDLLGHFESHSTELTETEAVKIPMQMMALYKECEGIPQYIQALEKAQRRSVRGNLPVADNVLAATAINALLSTGDYKDDTTSWLKKADTDRTWSAFKTHFSAAYLAEEQRKKYFGGSENQGQPFGGTAAPLPKNKTTTGEGKTNDNKFPAQMSDTMEGFLDNIAAVVTTDSGTMQQMVASLATLTATNTQQAAIIAAQQKTITSLTTGNNKKPNTYPSGAHPGYETGNMGYCWAHGYKLRKGHRGATCKSRDFVDNEDKRAATRTNTMGGCTDNKGFDD
jgi:hypothetical protein